ncbi:MAG: DUF6562 domain-containing protein [Rikenellaceae bacterium]
MKRLLYSLAALAIVATTACQESVLDSEIEAGDYATLTINAKALSSVESKAALADYSSESLMYYLEVYKDGVLYLDLGTSADGQFSTRLITGQEYILVAWADHDKGYYNTDDLTNVTIVDVATAYPAINTTDRDAFAGTETVTITENSTITFEITRPFARINVKTNDIADIPEGSGLRPTHVKLEYTETLYTAYNVLVGEVADDGVIGLTTAITAVIDSEGELSADYVFAPTEGGVAEFTAYYTADGADVTSYTFSSIPYKRNYQTNISGNLLTKVGDITVTVDPTWEGEIGKQVGTQVELEAAIAAGETYIVVANDIVISSQVVVSSAASVMGVAAATRADDEASGAITIDGMGATMTVASEGQILCYGSLNLVNFNIEAASAANAGVINVAAADVNLVVENCTIDYSPKGTSPYTSGVIIVDPSTGVDNVAVEIVNSTINLNSTYQCGVSFASQVQQYGSSLVLDNTLIYATTDDPNNATYTSGLSIGKVDGFTFEMINGSEIRNVYYGIIGYQYYHPTNFDFDIIDSEISGYGLMIRGDKGTFDIVNSTITGRNYYSSSSDFGTIVFTYDGSSDSGCTDIDLTIDNSTIKSYRSALCDQWLIQVRKTANTGNTINIINGSTLIDEVAEGVSYSAYLIEFDDNGTVVTTDGTEVLVGGSDVRLVKAIDIAGSGTSDDPYLIKGGYEFASLSNSSLSGYYSLQNDIDLTGYSFYNIDVNAGAVFEGNGHTIKNFSYISSYLKSTTEGLFSDINGTVQNLNLETALVSISDSYSTIVSIGSFAGAVGSAGKIINCSSDATMTFYNASAKVYLGGFAGKLAGGTISGCSFSGTINHDSRQTLGTVAGGIAGWLSISGSVIENCSFTGTVNGTAVGGLIGMENNCTYSGDGNDISEGTVNVVQ